MFNQIVDMIARNGVWVMIIAVVAIPGWLKFRAHELKIHQDLRLREMEHEREMKQLEVEMAKAKTPRETERVS